MEKEEFAELQHAHRAWTDNKYTQVLKTKTKEELRAAYQVFQSTCRTTSDPKVASAYMQWFMLSTYLSSMNEGPRDDE